VAGCQHGHKSIYIVSNSQRHVFVKLVLFTACQRQLYMRSLLHNKQMSVKSGGPFAYEKCGGATFYLSKVGGSNLKWGGHDHPTFNGGDAPGVEGC